MIRRHTLALSAICTLAFFSYSPTAAHAAGNHDTITIHMTGDKTQVDVKSSASASEKNTDIAGTRYFHRRHIRHAYRRTASLASRGAVLRDGTASSVVGRLAVVTADNAAIRGGRERYNRVLSVVPKGQNIAISGEVGDSYAVVMVDHTLGYIAKSDVELLSFQVVSNGSSGSVTSATSGGSEMAPPTDNDGTLGASLRDTAEEYLHVPYVWGGNTKEGIDCSGLVKAVFASHGIDLPRHSGDQAMVGYDVPRSDWSKWVPGDRMYFACHHPEIDHTGMYIGNGYFIHASGSHGHQVNICRVDEPYYAKHLVAVRRSQELLGDSSAPTSFRQTASATPSDTPVASSCSDPEADQQ